MTVSPTQSAVLGSHASSQRSWATAAPTSVAKTRAARVIVMILLYSHTLVGVLVLVAVVLVGVRSVIP